MSSPTPATPEPFDISIEIQQHHQRDGVEYSIKFTRAGNSECIHNIQSPEEILQVIEEEVAHYFSHQSAKQIDTVAKHEHTINTVGNENNPLPFGLLSSIHNCVRDLMCRWNPKDVHSDTCTH